MDKENVFKTLVWDEKGASMDGAYLNNLYFAEEIARTDPERTCPGLKDHRVAHG